MNNATFAGNLGQDCRTSSIQTNNGDLPVCNFSVGVRKRKKGDDGKHLTLWIDCALWGNRATALSQYLVKGQKVTVSGEVDVESYQKDGQTIPKMTLNVSNITLQGDSGQSGGNQQQGQPQQRQQPAQQPPMNQQQPNPQNQGQGEPIPPQDYDDDIPFQDSNCTNKQLINSY